MANKRIKGITIELDGNTQKLENALKNVEKSSKDVQSELKEIDKSLKFNPKDVDLLTQKQSRLKEAITLTEKELGTLKTASEQAHKRLQETGEGQKEFDAITREIKRAENQINSFKNNLNKVDTELEDIGSAADKSGGKLAEMGQDVTDAVKSGVFLQAGQQLLQGFQQAGEKLQEVLGVGLEKSKQNTKINIQLDLDEKGQEALQSAARTVKTFGADGEEALNGTLRLWKLNTEATDEQKKQIAEMAGALATAYDGLDYNELIQESYEVSKSLKIGQDEALGLVDNLLKAGFPPEQLDIIAEYGTQLEMAGYNAEEIQALFAAGVDTGTWNIDNLLDGVKEGRIKMSEFGAEIPKALDPLLEKAGWSQEEFKNLGQAIANGGDQGKQALYDVAYMLGEVDDKTLQNELGVQLFGTKWEDQGVNIINSILGIDDHLKSATENQAGLNSTVDQMKADPAVELQTALEEVKNSVLPLVTPLIEVVGSMATWAAENPKLVGTILAIIGAIGTLMPIIMAVIAIIGALGAPMLGTIGIIAAVIAAVVGLATAIALNWSSIKAKTLEVFNSVAAFLSNTWNSIKNTVISIWVAISSYLSDKWAAMKNTASTVFTGLKNTISGIWNGIKTKTSEVWNGIKSAITGPIEAAKNAVKRVIDAIKGFFNFKIKWPHIPKPHFGIRPSGWKIGDLLKGSIPKLSIDWYAQGGIFESPSIIGVGEAGKEAVLPTHKLDKFLEEAVKRVGASDSQKAEVNINIQNVEVRNDEDINKLAKLVAEQVDKVLQSNTKRTKETWGLA